DYVDVVANAGSGTFCPGMGDLMDLWLLAGRRRLPHSSPVPGPYFDCFDDFGERHTCSLVNCGDVRERLSVEDADGLSLARHVETSEMAHGPAVGAGLVGRRASCLLGGCVLIPSQARELPENKECRHAQLLSGSLRSRLDRRPTLTWRWGSPNRQTYVLRM